MTAHVIQIGARRGRGRQPREVEDLRDAREELAALVAEGRELADRIVAVSRRAERNLARGWSAANDLDELERLGLRHQARMASAGAAARVGAICPDGQTERHVGCGRAA